MNDLEKAFEALKTKQKLKKLFDYYDGDQPLVYSAERLKQAFGGSFTRFEQNWCSVVVNATLDRLNLKGFDVFKDATNDDALDEIWSTYHLQLDAIEAHRAALISGESFIHAWKRQDGTLDIYKNCPLMCHLFYKPEFPKEKDFGAKWYYGTDSRWHITLYYPDRLEYYKTNPRKTLPENINGFTSKDVKTNPFGKIPLFHFRCPSDLVDIVNNQDAINKLFADMMVAGEFNAFKQRWVISNADTDVLKNNPNEVWSIPGSDGVGQAVSVGEFQGEDLTRFTNAMKEVANFVAINTRTPRHYLADVGAGISGDALIAMEAPLVKKVEQRIEQFSVTWQELAAFLLRLNGKIINENRIIPNWGRVRSEQPLTEMQAVNFGTSSGIPLVTQLRKMGWDKEEITQMLKDQQEEQKRKATVSKVLLDEARKNQEQSPDTGYPAEGTINGAA